MRKDRQKALALRLQGFSYNEINQTLEIPKSTLSGWFTGLVLPKHAQERIQKRVYQGTLRGLIKRNKQQTHLAIQRTRNFRNNAKKEIQKVSPRELKLIGAVLYWCEGYKRQIKNKTHHPVSLSNADPNLIKMFLRFLKEICLVPQEKIRVNVRIFPHMNEEDALRYWVYITELPHSQFHKTYYGISSASRQKRPFNRLPYGTVRISVGDTQLFYRIMGWIDGIASGY